jgi:hypothetical protein
MIKKTKIIVSHDVDHLTPIEHHNDLIVPKFLLRAIYHTVTGQIGITEVIARIRRIIQNKWHNLDSISEYDKTQRLPSTFFFAVRRGSKLNYHYQSALYWMQQLLAENFDIGLHGVAYNDYNLIKEEYNIFKNITGLQGFGIRMHYLKLSESTLKHLSDIQYLFDSSVFELSAPYRIGCMWEFPLHIMDGHLFRGKRFFITKSLEQAKCSTIEMLNYAISKDLLYFNILFHDRYFSDEFCAMRDWYRWFIEYCKENNFEFISYRQAICEL